MTTPLSPKTTEKSRQKKNIGADTRIRVSNRFSVLQVDDQGEGECPAEEERHLVVGDSRVRPLTLARCLYFATFASGGGVTPLAFGN